jgi:hypothetical protein
MASLIHRYRWVATERAIRLLLARMSEDERAELNARLMAGNSTIQEYVGALLTAHERWDLVEWDELPEAPAEEEANPATLGPHPDLAHGSQRSHQR